MKGLIHTREFSAFHDEYVGMTRGKTVVKRKKNIAPLPDCFVATEPIESIFGAEVTGEIEAIGRTPEEALERLAKERKELNDSLWA